MKISTEIASTAALVGEYKAVEMIAKAGFDAWDFSFHQALGFGFKNSRPLDGVHPFLKSDYLHFARELRNIGEAHGIVCNQAHAPFPTHDPKVVEYCKRAIACTAEAGGKICIVHPQNNGTVEQNTALYRELLKTAKDYGIKIATENMWSWPSNAPTAIPAACGNSTLFFELLEAVNDPDLVVCLDIGHAQMEGMGEDAATMIRALGPHPQALHLHDNNNRHDLHALPFSMQTPWEDIIAALQDIAYKGDFTLEAHSHIGDCTEETLPTALNEMVAAARKLAAMFENR